MDPNADKYSGNGKEGNIGRRMKRLEGKRRGRNEGREEEEWEIDLKRIVFEYCKGI